jgi:uncharacterized SAM-binding protein YcdF (DUF218 family)
LILFLALVLAALGTFLFRSALLTALANPLVEDDGPHKADAALVFGGDEYCSRIIKAAQLVQAGYAPVVFVSSPAQYDSHEADFTIPCAVRHGYPAGLFQPVPSNSDSTRHETVLLGDFLRAHGIHTVLLVTSNYHTARAARMLRKQSAGITVYAEPASDPYFIPGSWWKTRTGQKTFLLEWTKTVATWLGV